MEKRYKTSDLSICFIYTLLFCKLLNAQPAADKPKWKIVEKKLHVPPLSELQTVFRAELSKNFAEVKVEIVDSPDFTKPPFNLAAAGLGGSATLIDIGGFSRYSIEIEKQPLYDVKTIVDSINYKKEAFLIGPGNGPWDYLKKECDIVVNVVLSKPQPTTKSCGITLDLTLGKFSCVALPLNATRIATQGNLFLSEGKPEKVLKVFAKKRIGEDSFTACLRRSITNQFGEAKLVGMGGVFVVQKGKVNHLFANVQQAPIPKAGKLTSLKYFFVEEGSAPEIGVGTFVSGKTELELIPNHFHILLSQEGHCGHYYQDTTPAIVEYEGYFTPAGVLYKVDQAPPYKTGLVSDHY